MKMLTLNIDLYEDKHGTWQERKDLICGVVRKERPDVLALQAVRKNSRKKGSRSQVEDLAKELKEYRDILFQGVMEHEDGVDGQAFLSKLPIRKTDFYPLMRHSGNEGNDDKRFLYYAAFDTETGPFHIYNCHFSHEGARNEASIREVLEFIAPANEPAVLTGDFNATPDQAAFRVFEEAGWLDLWPKLKGSEPGYTFEADHPSLRVDYVWANPLAVQRAIEMHLVSAQSPDTKVRLSAHLGISALFS